MKFWRVAFSRFVVIKAIKVALIVGVILNLINQGDVLIQMQFSQVNWFKFMLTFFVPYGVSTYSAAMAVVNRN